MPKQNRFLKYFLAPFLGLFLLASLTPSSASAKTVTSATLTFAVDDYATIYINGNLLGTWNSQSWYDTVTSTAVPIGWLTSACNVIAVTVEDCCAGASWISYKLRVNYSDATYDEIVSTAGQAQYYYDGIWSPGPLSMPPVISGKNWYETAYVPGGGWSPPQDLVPGSCSSKNATFNDSLGTVVPYIGAGCGGVIRYQSWSYRQPFSLSAFGPCATPTPTPIPATCAGGAQALNLYPGTTLMGGGPVPGNLWGCCTTSGRTSGLDACGDTSYAVSKGGGTPFAGWWKVATTAQTGTITSVKVHAFWATNGKAGDIQDLLFNYAADGTFTKVIADQEWLNPNPFYYQENTLSLNPPGGGSWSWTQINNLRLYMGTKADFAYVSCLYFEVCYTSPSSPTPSPSRTPSFTSTPTASPTPTATPTFSASPTFSPTRTQSPTPTATPTYTASPTFSPTPTATPTATPSPTFSDSPTPSSTPTGTPTYTATSTFSPTPTFSDSPTRTATPTPTFSFTPTPTYSDSPTGTPSGTPTATFSGTPTFSNSPTPSSSSTPSTTFTGTKTFSFTPTPSPSFTESFSFTGTKTFTDSPSPSPSQTESFSYTGTKTFTDSATETPSFTESASYTETKTPSPTKSETPTKSVTLTFSASPTYSPSPTISPTFTPSAPFVVSIKVFNSAGELVALLYSALPLYGQLSGVDVLQAVFDPDGVNQGVLHLQGPDLTIAWDGSGQGGQKVQSGSYLVLVQQTDPMGAVSSWTAPLSVIRSESGVELEVFNSAGELVWHRSVPLAGGSARMDLSSNRLVLGTSPFSSLKIVYGSGAADFVAWDGTNSAGSQVATGTYLVQMTQKDRQGAKQYFSKTVVVIRIQTQAFDRAIAWPNPAGPLDTILHIRLEGAQAGSVAWGEVYNLSGLRVASLPAGDAATGLSWSIPGSLAGGIYLARVSAQTGQGLKTSRSLKFVVVR
ncbi:MAG: hypothetical protein V4498_08870 [candidate division FCPU426 bacterium]